MSAPAFTAWASCPSCGSYECHAIRPPKPAPSEAELIAWERDRETVEIHTFGYARPRVVREYPPRPVDESAFEVVRTCRCGHEWGMA